MNVKEFNALGRKERKVFIAEDVLKQLRKLNVSENNYFSMNKMLSEYRGKELKDVLPKIRQKCHVCALGACFLSVVSIVDDFKICEDTVDTCCFSLSLTDDSWIDIESMSGHLKKVFTEREMALIEAAFERMLVQDVFPEADPAVAKAISFGLSYSDPKERLRAIMKNIIKNKGFKP